MASFFALFVLILFSQTSALASCESIDLNVNSPLSQMPILDQDGSGLCYAYAASQVVEYQLRKDGETNVLPSPLGLSLVPGVSEGIFIDTEVDDVTGGDDLAVINYAKKLGFMDKTCIELSLKKVLGDSKLTYSQLVALLHKYFEDRRFWKSKTEVISDAVKEVLGEKNQCVETEKELAKVLGLGDTVSDILKSLLSPCSSSLTKKAMPSFTILETGTDSDFIKGIDKILDKKNPVSTSLCSEAFGKKAGDKKFNGFSPPLKKGAFGNSLGRDCSPHAVVTVGRKKFNGKCHYLIRNSWGADWGTSEKLKCACKSKTKYYEDCSEINNIKDSAKFIEEDLDKIYLGCWVSQDSLEKNILSIGGFE